MSAQVNDCDIFNSHKKYRNGLSISDQAATVKRFSLPITLSVSPLLSHFPPILPLLSHERCKCWSFQRPCVAHPPAGLEPTLFNLSVCGCKASFPPEEPFCASRHETPGASLRRKKATSFFSPMTP